MGYHPAGVNLWRIVPSIVFILFLLAATAKPVVGVSEGQELQDDIDNYDKNDDEEPKDFGQKEELLELKKNLTQFYISESIRTKRSYNRQTYDIQLDQKENYFEAKVSSANAYPFVCYGKAFVLQADGVYRLDGLGIDVPIYYTESSKEPGLVKVSEWPTPIEPTARVLDVKEWEQKCVVLITNLNGTFSSIYTLHGPNMTPVIRQQMHNQEGVSMAAKFFTMKRNLYLIFVNDNAVHSLTKCLLFRWAGTYMDKIHEIYTRGATAVETFTVNSREYIAIAQSQDLNGNYEVGTQILRMDEKETLEKVQLLWSNNANSLQYVQVAEDHYLIIGQSREPSIAYWFDGIDFIQWQSLKSYTGHKLFMDSFLLPDKAPVLLAGKTSSIQLYSWSTTSSSLAPTSNSSLLSLKYPLQFSNAKFIRLSSQSFLTVVDNDRHNPTLKVYPIITSLVETAESQIKESESKLSQCMTEVRSKLGNDEAVISSLNDQRQKILTKSDNADFQGTIVTYGDLVVDPSSTSVNALNVLPLGFDDDEHYTTPSRLLTDLQAESYKIEAYLIPQLPSVLMKSSPGNISGNYTFLDEVKFIELFAPATSVKLETINGIPWSDIQEYAIRKSSEGSQIITGQWKVENMSVISINQLTQISNIEIDNFLLTRCSFIAEDFPQDIQGQVTFQSHVKFDDGIIMQPDGMVNDVKISDVVLKNGPVNEIRGYKHAQNLIGVAGFEFDFINEKEFFQWFNSVLHTDGHDQFSEGIKTFSMKGVKIENLRAVTLNNRDWNDFHSSVLLNGVDQTIEGNMVVERLDVENLETQSIGDIMFEDLLNANGSQTINSILNFSSLTFQTDLNTQLINGIPLSEIAVHRNDQDVIIEGPIELDNCKVSNSITIEEFRTISGRDVSELGTMRKKHIYYTDRASVIYLRNPVEAENLNSPSINGYLWEDLRSHFWTKHIDKVIRGPLDLRGRTVSVQNEFNTGTLNKIDLNSEDVISLDEPSTISTPLSFVGDVRVFGNVEQADEKTINGMDISEIAQGIVKLNEEKLIRGVKYFQSDILAAGGIDVAELNGIDLADQLIFLNSSEIQYLQDTKYFKSSIFVRDFHAEGDIIVEGNVNEHNLAQVFQTTAFQDQPLLISGNLLFNKSFYSSFLTIRKELNDANLTDLFQNIIFLNEPQNINFPLVLHNGEISFQQSVQVESINGIQLEEHFPRIVTITPPKMRINGTKTFINLHAKDVSCNSFNGISLAELSENALSSTKHQNLTGKFYLKVMKIDSNLNTPEISEVSTKDLVFTDDPEMCFIDTDVIFKGGATVNGPLTIGGQLNGYPVEKLYGGMDRGLNNRNFDTVIVAGNLDWDEDDNEYHGISDILNNAVTLDTPQTITGKVHFTEGFEARQLNSDPWVNGVDVGQIQADAVSNDDSADVFQGINRFTGTLEINDPNLNIEILNVERVDGINLKELDNSVIRDGFNGTIFGEKIIEGDINADNLNFKVLQNKGDFGWLYRNGDNRTINEATLILPTTVQNLNYAISDQFNLDEFLKNRLTKDGDQTIVGDFTVDSLNVNRDCNIQSINGIPVKDIYNNSNDNEIVDGHKTFSNGVYIDGEADVADVNGYNFESLHSDVYRRTDKEKIDRPVIFSQPVTFTQSVQVDNDINDYRIEDLSARFANALKGVEARALATNKPPIQNLEKFGKLQKELTEKPMWLEYLRLKQDWSILGPKSRVEYTPVVKSGGIIAIYDHSTPVIEIPSLPNGCKCNNAQFLNIDRNSVVTADPAHIFQCTNIFIITSDSGNIFTVTDDSVSYNQTCKTTEQAILQITKGLISDDTSGPIVILKQSSRGYLTDAKAFYDSGTDYIMLTYFFDYKNGNHDSGTYVYKVNANNHIILIQTIPSSGPVRLDINNFDGKWFAAIANNRDPKSDSCLTNSAIYRWEPEKFLLVREVRTNGALDVAFISIQDKGVNYEVGVPTLNFVAFAQSGNSGDGEISILSYDPVRENYFAVQSLRTQWSVTSVEFFCIQENCYLMTVIPQEGILFYEYRYVEGFQLTLTVPIMEAQDIVPFASGRMLEKVAFAVASSKKSLLAEGVIAGQPHILYDGALMFQPENFIKAKKSTSERKKEIEELVNNWLIVDYCDTDEDEYFEEVQKKPEEKVSPYILQGAVTDYEVVDECDTSDEEDDDGSFVAFLSPPQSPDETLPGSDEEGVLWYTPFTPEGTPPSTPQGTPPSTPEGTPPSTPQGTSPSAHKKTPPSTTKDEAIEAKLALLYTPPPPKMGLLPIIFGKGKRGQWYTPFTPEGTPPSTPEGTPPSTPEGTSPSAYKKTPPSTTKDEAKLALLYTPPPPKRAKRGLIPIILEEAKSVQWYTPFTPEGSPPSTPQGTPQSTPEGTSPSAHKKTPPSTPKDEAKLALLYTPPPPKRGLLPKILEEAKSVQLYTPSPPKRRLSTIFEEPELIEWYSPKPIRRKPPPKYHDTYDKGPERFTEIPSSPPLADKVPSPEFEVPIIPPNPAPGLPLTLLYVRPAASPEHLVILVKNDGISDEGSAFSFLHLQLKVYRIQ